MSFHVIIGAGPTGATAARLLADAGDRVRLVTRRGSGPAHPFIERVAADATDENRLTALTEGAATLFNCAMPAYDRWPIDFPPLAAALLTTAERTGARYVMLGNIYGYGAVDGPITEGLPLAATTVKGRVRAKIWNDALESHAKGKVRATEVRASDFIGRGALSIYTIMAAPRLVAGEPASLPADLDAPHSWTYTGDVARTLVAASRSEEAWGRGWLVPSSTLSTRALTARLTALAGAPPPRLTRMSVRELEELGASNPLLNEVLEMLYLYDRPCVVDSSHTERTLGVAATAFDEALRDLLSGYSAP